MLKKSSLPAGLNMAGHIYLVPVGQQISPLLEGFRYVKNIAKVCLLCTAQTKGVAKELCQKIEPIFRQCDIVETSADDLDKIVSDVLDLVKENKGAFGKDNLHKMFIINLTGGTKMMSLGCYIAGLFFAEKVLYIFKTDSGKMRLVDVPMVKVELADFTKRKGVKMELLRKILAKPSSLDGLTKECKLSKPTVWAHLKGLEEKHLVEKIENGKAINYVITTTGKLLLNVEELKYGKK